MVCNLTTGKDKWSTGWPAADVASQVAAEVLSRSGPLAQEDSDAFDLVVAAFRMPKETDAEKSTRRTAIRAGTLRAAEVPLETAQLGMKLLGVLEGLARNGNGNAASDVGVASLLASAAVKGALFNVDINVSSLPESMSTALVEATIGMREECSARSRLVMHAVHDRISS
jgi:formiminotetrahydrofolate cyclodeaminase